MNLEKPHKRYNPLSDEWVLVSPHRSKRPWQGQQEKPATSSQPSYSENCYLCPGNERVGGEKNPGYTSTYVFTNDFSALLPNNDERAIETNPLFRAQPEKGICKVICFSPRHDLSLARFQPQQARKVVDTWTEEYQAFGQYDFINYVQIFENKGETMGCSNPHPHGQIWATGDIPNIPARELENQQNYLTNNKSCLLCDYLQQELERNERIIFTNDSFVALVPYWAVWPFETMLLPRRHVGSLIELTDKEKDDLAGGLIRMGTHFDNLFMTSFPYSMGLHQTPVDGKGHPEHHFHIHYLPPLLRSATVKKFMVGFEMLAMPQRDLTAEDCAARLRQTSTTHYLAKG